MDFLTEGGEAEEGAGWGWGVGGWIGVGIRGGGDITADIRCINASLWLASVNCFGHTSVCFAAKQSRLDHRQDDD